MTKPLPIGSYLINQEKYLSPANEVAGRYVFSCVSVCSQGGGPMWPLPVTHWTSPHRDTLAPDPAPDMDQFKHALHCTGTPLPDMFKFVHYEACTVVKWVVGVLPKCFLVVDDFFYFSTLIGKIITYRRNYTFIAQSGTVWSEERAYSYLDQSLLNSCLLIGSINRCSVSCRSFFVSIPLLLLSMVLKAC